MTLIVSELYDALRAAGVAEDRAVAAARATLFGHAPGFMVSDALWSVGVSGALAHAAATADYRAERTDD